MNSKRPPKSKARGVNPKDLFGLQKISLCKVSPIAWLHCAHAMMNGADKYGPYNWRDKPVIASIYVDASLRHVLAWFLGEEVADDSHVHHLGHAMASESILLDAQEAGVLIDDRPIISEEDRALFKKVMDRLSALVAQSRQERKFKEEQEKRKNGRRKRAKTGKRVSSSRR